MEKTSRLQGLLGKIISKIENTELADVLFGAGPQEDISFKLSNAQDGEANDEFKVAFEYPNTVEFNVNGISDFDKSGNAFDESEDMEAALALAVIHELCHRLQSRKTGGNRFYEFSYRPSSLTHAEIIIEAENYARTAQIAWRMGHDARNPYQELARYMTRAELKKDKDSGSFAVYAAHMKDKTISPDNELAAMQAVVSWFFFESIMPQIYLRRRIEMLGAYINSGRLDSYKADTSPDELRAWMMKNPIIWGMGPDARECDWDDLVKIGDYEGENILALPNDFIGKIVNPGALKFFTSDEDWQALVRIENYCASFSAALLQKQQAQKPDPRVD